MMHVRNNCKATAVTHTKRIDRNLLLKETSFVCCTSSVLRKSRHMQQKEKITHSVVAVFSGGVAIVLNFCNLQFL